MTFEHYLIIAVSAVPAIVCTIVAIASIIKLYDIRKRS